ncbi:WD domain protein [Coelomomyces lativittatus]|nr:WD domain protein [Coelomomyces lativittatus]
MWDTITGECIKIIPAHADPVSCVQFVMDGSFFASGSYDGLIRLWDTKTGHCLKTLVLNENTSVGGLVFSPNGKYILASTLNNALYLWNIDTGQLERFFRGHTNEQYCLFPCLINDKLKLDASNHSVDQVNKSEMKASDFIVCGSEDGQICFWELQSSYLLAKKTAHSAPVLAVDYCPINSILVTGAIDPDRTLKVWTLKSSAIEKDENPSQSPVKEKDESPTSSSPNLEVETVEMKMEA